MTPPRPPISATPTVGHHARQRTVSVEVRQAYAAEPLRLGAALQDVPNALGHSNPRR